MTVGSTAEASSFREVRDRVYANPSTELSTATNFSAATLAKAMAGFATELMNRARKTFAEPVDFKARAPKFLHPMGVCAEATWRIDGESPATGLLERGTEVRAMVRLSSATNDVRYKPGKTRVFGMAVKLFPTQDENASVETANVFTLDRFELDGSDRPLFLFPAPGQEALYFSNIARGNSLIAKLGNKLFEQIDPHPELRPLYPITEVNQRGQRVAKPATPKLSRFYPRAQANGSKLSSAGADFREELMAYGPGAIAFDIVVPRQDGVARDFKVGSLTLGQPVMSVVCDQELHFHHPRTR